MSANLDFRTLKKSYFNVTLADDTVLMIGIPTKRTITDMIELGKSLNRTQSNLTDDGLLSGDDITVKAMEELYSLTAKVMSHNKAGKKISAEQLAEMFDFEDIFVFFNKYMEFIQTIGQSKN